MKNLLVLLFVIGVSLSALNAQERLLRVTVNNENPAATGYIDLRMDGAPSSGGVWQPSSDYIFNIRRITAPYEKAPFSFYTSVFLGKTYELEVSFRMTGTGLPTPVARAYYVTIPANAVGNHEIKIDPGYLKVWYNETQLMPFADIVPW